MKIKLEKNDTFIVTGVTRSGKRFKITTGNFHHASSINVWRGTLWIERNGKRKVLCSYWN